MRKIILILTFVLFAVVCIGAETNLYMNIQILRDDGSSESTRVKLEGWEFTASTNEGEYAVLTVRAKDVIADSNSVHIGNEVISANGDGIKVRKLTIDYDGAAPGKQKVKKADVEIMDPEYGIHFNYTNALGETRGWLQWVDYEGNLQTTLISESPEIAFSNRVKKMAVEYTNKVAIKGKGKAFDWDAPGFVTEKLKVIAQDLGYTD